MWMWVGGVTKVWGVEAEDSHFNRVTKISDALHKCEKEERKVCVYTRVIKGGRQTSTSV